MKEEMKHYKLVPVEPLKYKRIKDHPVYPRDSNPFKDHVLVGNKLMKKIPISDEEYEELKKNGAQEYNEKAEEV